MSTRSCLHTLGTAFRLTLVLTVVLGVLYPLVVTGIARLAFADRAAGSLLRNDSGVVVGSKLIGQSFSSVDGHPLPEYFQPRPSAVDYDASSSGGTNLGPQSALLVRSIEDRRRAVATFNGVPESAVPPDALTASGSGLDPDISPAYAALQVDRVARARGLAPGTVRRLVDRYTRGPDFGFLGQSRVNVVELNLALDQTTKPARARLGGA